MSLFEQKMIALAVLSVASPLSIADTADLEARIRQLEKTIKLIHQQRSEQDKQIEIMMKELVGVEHQISQSKIVKSEEKGSSKGAPIYGAFKDGLVFEDGTDQWKLQLNGRIQTDYRTYHPDEWKNDTFSVRRARFGGTFSFLNDFALRVEGEYANENQGQKATTALTYGYLDFNRWSGAKIRAGQFKPFFGLERTYSTNFTDFTELSLATNNGAVFTSTYDRGVMVFGDPLPWLNYNAYIVNGSGQNNDDVKDSKDIGGRINANFANFTEQKDLILHAGASASKGSIGFSTAAGNGLTQSTEASGVQFFNANNLTIAESTDRSRWGIETAVVKGPVKIQAEYIESNFEGRRGAGTGVAFDNDIKTWYVDINWLITGESFADAYKGGVFGRIKPKHNFDSKNGWGAFELGVRYSKFDASDFQQILAAPTATTSFTSEADAWTAGAKWIFNPNARVLLNYVRTDFDTDILVNSKLDDTEEAVVLRAQYDF
jgi:phosphate-selective porin OprO/OprP